MSGLRAASKGDRMKRPFGVCLSLIFALAPVAVAQEKSPLKLVGTTPLPGFSGDFDHFALDLKGKRLFLTAEDHKTVRSEEHTSELQSQSNLVCRLLLEKKKTICVELMPTVSKDTS